MIGNSDVKVGNTYNVRTNLWSEPKKRKITTLTAEGKHVVFKNLEPCAIEQGMNIDTFVNWVNLWGVNEVERQIEWDLVI